MAIERVVTQGWFSRLRDAFGGVLVGLILIVGAAALQFWNEGRSFDQQRLLQAARDQVTEVGAERVHPQNAGKLVHLTGELSVDEMLLDPDFGQPAEGLALRRQVEMYQWAEKQESRTETAVGGSQTTRTVYSYQREWSEQPIDDNGFEQREGHRNPGEFPFRSKTWRASDVRLGGFRLADSAAAAIEGWKPMAAEVTLLPDNLAVSLRKDGRYLSSSDAPEQPEVGDLRISFERIPVGKVSMLAAQQDDMLVAWAQPRGELLLLERGEHSAEGLLGAAHRRNTGLAWALRLGGLAAMWLGFSLLFAPLAVALDLLPMAGRATRWVTGLVSAALAAGLSLLVIGSGFLLQRPWWAAAVVLATIAGVWMLRRRSRHHAAELPPALPVAPPPPPPPAPAN